MVIDNPVDEKNIGEKERNVEDKGQLEEEEEKSENSDDFFSDDEDEKENLGKNIQELEPMLVKKVKF